MHAPDHHLVMDDRNQNGETHIHRWAPSCSCGKWTGVFRKRRGDAVALHTTHAALRAPSGGRGADRSYPRRRTPAPIALLDEMLREREKQSA